MQLFSDGVSSSRLERCERCHAPLIRNPDQPLLCGVCAPARPAMLALRKMIAALHAERGTSSDMPETRRAAQ